ncbi:MAG: hypothetical protein ACKVJE_21940 [Pseudomonadales bacterium]
MKDDTVTLSAELFEELLSSFYSVKEIAMDLSNNDDQPKQQIQEDALEIVAACHNILKKTAIHDLKSVTKPTATIHQIKPI